MPIFLRKPYEQVNSGRNIGIVLLSVKLLSTDAVPAVIFEYPLQFHDDFADQGILLGVQLLLSRLPIGLRVKYPGSSDI